MTVNEVVLQHRLIDQNGKHRMVWVCLDGQYSLWEDGLRWRWALREWPDDGCGIPTHGAQPTIEQAVQVCLENKKIREDEKELQKK